jgi:hypothetical protein
LTKNRYFIGQLRLRKRRFYQILWSVDEITIDLDVLDRMAPDLPILELKRI